MRCFLMILSALCLSASAYAANILVQSPLGGEAYFEGLDATILTKTNLKTETVELSKDGGATFSPLGTINNRDKNRFQRNRLVWAVKGPASTSCVLRFTGKQGKKTIVVLSKPFVIITKAWATGDQGLQGLTGPAGPEGPAGPKGDTGDIGSMGPQGAAGSQGIAGPKGATGSQGPQGVAGPKGATGPQGPAGASCSATDVANLLKNDKDFLATLVKLLKDDPDFCKSCKGDKGDKGDCGPKGDKGDKGDDDH